MINDSVFIKGCGLTVQKPQTGAKNLKQEVNALLNRGVEESEVSID